MFGNVSKQNKTKNRLINHHLVSVYLSPLVMVLKYPVFVKICKQHDHVQVLNCLSLSLYRRLPQNKVTVYSNPTIVIMPKMIHRKLWYFHGDRSVKVSKFTACGSVTHTVTVGRFAFVLLENKRLKYTQKQWKWNSHAAESGSVVFFQSLDLCSVVLEIFIY